MRCLHPLTVSPYKNIKRYIQVPCGKCPECRKTKRDDLTFRLDAEYHSKDTICVFFIGLSYSDKYLPHNIDVNSGESFPCVSPEDVHNFFKYFRKLSKSYDLRFKYFLSSEYGDKFGRPHYHLLLFVKEFNSRNWLDDMRSLVERAWYRGFVDVQFPKGSFSACAYVSKYVLKQCGLELRNGFVPTFTRWSIGLGKSIIDNYKPSYDSDLKFTDSQNRVHILPRYYHSKIFNDIDLKRHQLYTKLYTVDKFIDKHRRTRLEYYQLDESEYDKKTYDSMVNLRKLNRVTEDDFYKRYFENM